MRVIARRRRVRRRRTAVILTGCASFAAGLMLGANGDQDPPRSPSPSPGPELPRGGRSLLPEHRLVGYYGAPQSPELGALGVGAPAEAAERLLKQARAYRGGRPVLPVFELLATIAASEPGEDGEHILRQPHAVISRYLAEARRRRALLLLDIQPGRSDFPSEFERLRRYMSEPDVGLALDPEWQVGPDEVPGQVIGSVDAATVNEISARLAAIVRRHRLPEKLLVIHQFTPGMIADRWRLRDRAGIATVINVDGFGDPPNKVAKYRQLRPPRDSSLDSGLKLFYAEDVDLMQPADVLRLRPRPDLIVYE